jgi:hypothetical protein
VDKLLWCWTVSSVKGVICLPEKVNLSLLVIKSINDPTCRCPLYPIQRGSSPPTIPIDIAINSCGTEHCHALKPIVSSLVLKDMAECKNPARTAVVMLERALIARSTVQANEAGLVSNDFIVLLQLQNTGYSWPDYEALILLPFALLNHLSSKSKTLQSPGKIADGIVN